MTAAQKVKTHTVEINAKDYPFEGDHITLADIRRLGNIPANHKVYHEIPEPKDDPEVTEKDRIKLGKLEKFYSVAPEITGGSGALRTARIDREIATVAEKYPGTTAVDVPDGSVGLIIPALPIPAGFTGTTARILVRIPAMYPSERLDLFWLAPTLARDNGAALPNVMTHGVPLAGEQWTQISWHDNSPHDPERISVLGFVRGIGRWFAGQVGA